MKRIGYLHEKVCDWDNIELADKNTRKHKNILKRKHRIRAK